MCVIHPDTKCLQEVTFLVVSHEGSVIISCATSIDLNVIQPHRDLDVVPQIGSLISSKTDLPMKQKNKNSRDEQSPKVSRVQKIEMNQYVNHKLQIKSKQQQCQSTVLKGKNFQAEKCVHMWPKKPTNDMLSNGSAILIQHNTLQKSQEDDKNCQINRRPVKSKVCADNKCQANKYYKEIEKKCQAEKSVIKWPVKPRKNMWLKKPAAKDKNCQVIMCNKKQVPLSKDNSCKSSL